MAVYYAVRSPFGLTLPSKQPEVPGNDHALLRSADPPE